MFAEVMEALSPRRGGHYVDLTLGAGGHSEGLLRNSAPDGRLLAFDLDAQAIKIASDRLAAFADRMHLVHASYLNIKDELALLDWPRVDGIVVDFGASSMQFDQAERGFSFMQQGPLDMRFDQGVGLTASQIINTWEADQLVMIFKTYGEERNAKRIARAVINTRPIDGTKHLADVIEAAVGRGRERIHPATRVFQALRIAVNDELESVEKALPLAVDALKAGGRLAAITFHSLEDRIVKHAFKQMSAAFTPQPDQPQLVARPARVRLVTKKPRTAGPQEVQSNPRARSAKLRVVEKL
jgi:16S rRNA (cytosine1402-N4)-methyltransferase